MCTPVYVKMDATDQLPVRGGVQTSRNHLLSPGCPDLVRGTTKETPGKRTARTGQGPHRQSVLLRVQAEKGKSRHTACRTIANLVKDYQAGDRR